MAPTTWSVEDVIHLIDVLHKDRTLACVEDVLYILHVLEDPGHKDYMWVTEIITQAA